MRKLVVLVVMLAGVLMLAPMTQAITLATLESTNGSITVGDKVFSDFHCLTSGSGFTSGDCNAEVSGITSGTDVGIRVHDFFAAIGDGAAGAHVDVTFTYDVATLSGAATIHDVGMAFNATNPIANATTTVDEKVCLGDITTLCGSPIADIFVQRTHVGASTIVKLSDHADFSSLASKITVFKDIGLAADKNGNVSFSVLDQTFSQVPEPGSIALLGTALFGCAAILRRRMKRPV